MARGWLERMVENANRLDFTGRFIEDTKKTMSSLCVFVFSCLRGPGSSSAVGVFVNRDIKVTLR